MEEHEYFFGLEGPLDAIPGNGQMRSANLRGFAEHVRGRGGDPQRILKRCGLDPRALVDPDRYVSCQHIVDVFEYCAEQFDDPLFGLRLARAQDADVFGCITALCRAAPDLRTATQSLIDFISIVHSPEAELKLASGAPGMVELRWAVRSDLGINDQANYQAVMLILKLLRTVSGGHFEPSIVKLAMNPRQHDLAEIEDLLECPVQSQAPYSAICFAEHQLDRPVASANRLIFRLLGGYLARLRIVNRQNTVERVQSYVRGALPAGNCSAEHGAEKLGLSVRTLQARLAAHGVNFSELVEQQRAQLAKIYLLQTRMPLSEVAARLGYGEQTSFGRAFRRWTGRTPKMFRMGR